MADYLAIESARLEIACASRSTSIPASTSGRSPRSRAVLFGGRGRLELDRGDGMTVTLWVPAAAAIDILFLDIPMPEARRWSTWRSRPSSSPTEAAWPSGCATPRAPSSPSRAIGFARSRTS